MKPESTAVLAAASALVVSITVLGLLARGESKMRPKTVIAQDELAGTGAPVGDEL